MNTQEMNTHELFKTLLQHGFTEEQSEGITQAIYSFIPNNNNFVRKELFEESEKESHETRTDISVMKGDITTLKTDVAVLKTDVAVLKTDVADVKDTMATKTELDTVKDTMATKTDLAHLQFKLESDMEKLYLKIQGEIKDSHNDMLKWIIPLFMTVIVGVIGSIAPLVLQFFG